MTKRAAALAIPSELRQMEKISRLMDAQFRIPGTSFRFGFDGLIGLVPGAGDISTLAVSGYLILMMARNGASGNVLARMSLNVLADAIIGAIPFIGDLFDFAFKANRKNYRLMQRYYQEGRYRGSAWKVIVPLLLVLGLVVAGSIYLSYKLIAFIF